MKPLTQWLDQQEKGTEERALNYLNNKGFYCHDTKVSDRRQIEIMEKENKRNPYFLECIRKLKNSIRQYKYLNKTGDCKQYNFTLTEETHNRLKLMAGHDHMSINQKIQELIEREYMSRYTKNDMLPNQPLNILQVEAFKSDLKQLLKNNSEGFKKE